jgi:hypothetical protein
VDLGAVFGQIRRTADETADLDVGIHGQDRF